jgi:hypothetical protein
VGKFLGLWTGGAFRRATVILALDPSIHGSAHVAARGCMDPRDESEDDNIGRSASAGRAVYGERQNGDVESLRERAMDDKTLPDQIAVLTTDVAYSVSLPFF